MCSRDLHVDDLLCKASDCMYRLRVCRCFRYTIRVHLNCQFDSMIITLFYDDVTVRDLAGIIDTDVQQKVSL